MLRDWTKNRMGHFDLKRLATTALSAIVVPVCVTITGPFTSYHGLAIARYIRNNGGILARERLITFGEKAAAKNEKLLHRLIQK